MMFSIFSQLQKWIHYMALFLLAAQNVTHQGQPPSGNCSPVQSQIFHFRRRNRSDRWFQNSASSPPACIHTHSQKHSTLTTESSDNPTAAEHASLKLCMECVCFLCT